MPPVKHILFPTDFSDNARKALNFALEIASHSGATIHMVHSIEESYNFAPMVDHIKELITSKTRQLFDDLKKEIQKQEKYARIDIKTSIRTGRSTSAILEEAKNEKCDLIVIGTCGRSNLERFLYGSTTAQLVQQADVPVLVIPEKAEFKGFQKVIFSTDFHDGDLQALQYVIELGRLFHSSINILHASVEDDLKSEILFRGFRELVKEITSYDNINFEQDKSISFFEAVADRIDNKELSLMVMVKYSRPYSIFAKKQSKEMSYYIQVPLLVLPGEKIMNSGSELSQTAKNRFV